MDYKQNSSVHRFTLLYLKIRLDVTLERNVMSAVTRSFPRNELFVTAAADFGNCQDHLAKPITHLQCLFLVTQFHMWKAWARNVSDIYIFLKFLNMFL